MEPAVHGNLGVFVPLITLSLFPLVGREEMKEEKRQAQAQHPQKIPPREKFSAHRPISQGFISQSLEI
jgi:hypothetical protein